MEREKKREKEKQDISNIILKQSQSHTEFGFQFVYYENNEMKQRITGI